MVVLMMQETNICFVFVGMSFKDLLTLVHSDTTDRSLFLFFFKHMSQYGQDGNSEILLIRLAKLQ